MSDSEEDSPCVVIDAGSRTFRAGLAGEDICSVVFPSTLGSHRFTGKPNVDTYVGNKAQEMRDFLSLRYPIQRGIVSNWEDMETLIHHAYSELNVCSKDHPVLFSHLPLQSRSHNEYMAQLMYETFDCPALCLADGSHLCLFASGRNCAVTVNIGEGVTYAVPFYEGYFMKHSIQRQEFGGQDVTQYLQKLLHEKGYSFSTPSEVDSVREMKEKLCYTSLDFDSEGSRVESSSHLLQDGTEVVIKDEKYLCPEILFQPSKFGFEGVMGIQHIVYQALIGCEMDTHKNMLTSIMIYGGSVKIPGFQERLRQELKELLPKTLRINVLPCEGQYSTWIGGSILGCLRSVEDYLVTKASYEEHGPLAVHRQLSKNFLCG